MRKTDTQIFHERLEPFKSLWKLDNREWVTKRASDWKLLKKHYFYDVPRKELETYQLYFLEGFLDDVGTGPTILYLLTPMSSASYAKKYVKSDCLRLSYTKQALLTNFFSYTEKASCISWYKNHCKYLAAGVLGKKYRILTSKDPDGEERVYSPNIDFFCRSFFVSSTALFNGEFKYCGYIEILDYFNSLLPHVNREKFDLQIHHQEWLDAAKGAASDSSVSGEARKFAIEVLERKDQICASWDKNIHIGKSQS